MALLAYQFGKERSAIILATALTLRVTAFIIFSPFAGVLADRVSRKAIFYTTHFIRMAIVACLPFVNQEWQIYALVFLLNVFIAFFTPTYRAVIPQVVEYTQYRQAVGLSTATFQILGASNYICIVVSLISIILSLPAKDKMASQKHKYLLNILIQIYKTAIV